MTNPTQESERIDIVDILRGFAVLGILVANMSGYAGYSTNPFDYTGLNRFLINALHVLIEAKFYSLFSFLFGWGMAIQMQRAFSKERRFVPTYLRRMLILLLIGAIHGILIWFGDILTVYALLGFLLLLFRRRSPRFLLTSVGLLLTLAAVLTLPALQGFHDWYNELTLGWRYNAPYPPDIYSSGTFAQITAVRLEGFFAVVSGLPFFIGNVFSMFLLGLYVGKRRLLHNVHEHLSLVQLVAVLGLVIGLVFNALFLYFHNKDLLTVTEYGRFFAVTARTIGAPFLMLGYTSTIILLAQTARGQAWLTPLAPVGRMALTNYISHSIIGTLIFYNYGLGFYNQAGPTSGLVLAVLIYLAQIRWSAWWLERYRFGPLEWVWRGLTYGRFPPIRQGELTTDDADSTDKRGFFSFIRTNPRYPRSILLAVFIIALLFVGRWVWLAQTADSDTPAFFFREPEATPVAETAVQPTPRPAEPFIVATPVVEPVAYNPSAIAASGDLQTLVAQWDVEVALGHIAELTGPRYAGRMAGSPGGRAAADYIAARFAEYGLQPAGDDGTFFQSFPITYTELTEEPVLNVLVGDTAVPQTRYQDYSPYIYGYAGWGEGQGEVVWLPRCLDDFDGLQMVGKVALCQNMYGRDAIFAASRSALEHGALGLLLLYDPELWPPRYGNIYRETWVPEPIPTFRVYPELVADLLNGQPITDMLTIEEPTTLAAQVQIDVETTTASHEARNVLGVIPGRDPNFAHEVVIIGGHFDHLGQSPEGTRWAGANDNASGIAALLEIARSWHEQGYVPRRTVVFAAWDAEEHGLFGSTHYVNQPRYPLENTIAAIQMDMVGAGIDTLSISGGTPLADRLQDAADLLAVDSAVIDLGRSDHVPFLQAGVPSSLLIWVDESVDLPHYHRPNDLLDIIEPEKLTAAAQVAETTLLDLADSEPAIRALLLARQTAVNNVDLNAFLDTSHPSQRTTDARWFEDLLGLSPEKVEIRPSDIELRGAEAGVAVNINLTLADEETLDATIQARFVQSAAGWQWAGVDVATVTENDLFTIAAPSDVTADLIPLSQMVSEKYRAIARQLGLPETTQSNLLLLPDAQTLRTSTALSLPPGQTTWVEPGLVKLVYSPAISTSQALPDALAQLLLANVGVTAADADWLWRGLPLLLQEQADLVKTQTDLLPQVQAALAEPSNQLALDWAAVSYLRGRLGWHGLGEFIADVGQVGMEAALQNAIGTSDFEGLWQESWRNRLASVQTDLDTLMARRQTAVADNDKAAFLATVDDRVPSLLAAEQYWFENATDMTMTASPLALLANGDVLATVTWTLESGSVSGLRLFTAVDDGYLWAGAPLETLAGDRVAVRYANGRDELAQVVRQDAERIYAQLAQTLAISPTQITLELYETAADYRMSISPDFKAVEWAQGWTAPDVGVKMLAQDNYTTTLTIQLARQLLYQMGVTDEWLLKGVSVYLARPFDGGATQMAAAAMLPELQTAVLDGTLPDLFSLPADDALSSTRYGLVQAQAWDAVRYWVETQGWDGLLALLHESAVSANFAEDWLASLAQGHVRAEWLDVVRGFDVATAVSHLNALTQPEMTGRLAGTPGAEMAADYIAQQFAAVGLQPAGGAGTYFQPFSITHTTLAQVPTLSLVVTETAVSYAYRDEFLLAYPANGAVSGELVWVQGLPEEGQLAGKIVLTMPARDVVSQVAALAERGAAAVVLVTFKREEEDLLSKRPIQASDIMPIPVFELTQAGYNRFLDSIGQERTDMDRLPAIYPLGVTANLDVPLTTPEQVMTTNVLAVLPGSDPVLSQEIIIVGAHYDHVGDDPNGLRYSGANDNASGTAVLLELARLWQEANYRPQRTILFAAWGAQELGQLGSICFVTQLQNMPCAESGSPLSSPFALQNIIGVIQLDGVGGGDGFNLGAQAEWAEAGQMLWGMQTAESLLEEKLLITSQTMMSDQTSFREAGLPTLLVAWRLADDSNLPDEAAYGVHENRLAVTGRMVALTVMTMAQ